MATLNLERLIDLNVNWISIVVVGGVTFERREMTWRKNSPSSNWAAASSHIIHNSKEEAVFTHFWRGSGDNLPFDQGLPGEPRHDDNVEQTGAEARLICITHTFYSFNIRSRAVDFYQRNVHVLKMSCCRSCALLRAMLREFCSCLPFRWLRPNFLNRVDEAFIRYITQGLK